MVWSNASILWLLEPRLKWHYWNNKTMLSLSKKKKKISHGNFCCFDVKESRTILQLMKFIHNVFSFGHKNKMSYQLQPVYSEMFLEFFSQMVPFCIDSSILSHKCCGKYQTFFKLSLIQWNELIIFWRCLFVFPLNGHTIAAFDLTKALLPFPTCLLVCVTLGFTPSITQNKRIALTHKTQESEILELQIILLSSGQLHKSLNN